FDHDGQSVMITDQSDEWGNNPLVLEMPAAANYTLEGAVNTGNAFQLVIDTPGAMVHLVYDASESKVFVNTLAFGGKKLNYIIIDSDTTLNDTHKDATLYIIADAVLTLPPISSHPNGYDFQLAPSGYMAHAISLAPSGADPVRDNETVVVGDCSVSLSPDRAQWLVVGEAMETA
ncbi:MAG: hypothetical protein ACPH5V_09140, partial [Alcanivorax sp.]